MKTLVVLLLCMSTQAFAQSEAIRQCLSKSGVLPLQILAKTSIPKKDLDMTLFTICDEMDDPKYEDTPAHFAQVDPWYDQAVSVVARLLVDCTKRPSRLWPKASQARMPSCATVRI